MYVLYVPCWLRKLELTVSKSGGLNELGSSIFYLDAGFWGHKKALYKMKDKAKAYLESQK